MAASSADVLRRLEAVAARLEQYASALPAEGSSSGGGGGRRTAEVKEAPAVAAYNAFYAKSVVPFLAAIKEQKEINFEIDIVESAFKHAGVVVQAASKCKKPADAVLMKFIGPVANAISTADKKVDNRSPFMPQQKSIAEGLNALNWLVMPGVAKDIVQNGLEQADFYLIKLLTAAKAKTGDEQKNLREFVSTFKALFNGLGEYVDEYHTKGLDWSPKGGDISTFTPAAAGAAPAPAAAEEESAGGPPPPPGPPPSAEELSGGSSSAPPKVGGAAPGMGAVFDSISKGLDVTKGLKKVDNSQKAKNMKDVPVLVPKEKKTETKAAPKAAAASKPPKLELTKGTWFCENYENQELEIPDVEIKQSVYILKARNCTITVPNKCKSISVDGCFKTRVIFRSVVSNFELFNSQRVTADCQEVFPSIAIDKSSGCIVVCSRAGLASPPQVVTSNISECNIQVPGPKEEDDPIEIPIPEQFETRLLTTAPPHRLSTNPIAHGE